MIRLICLIWFCFWFLPLPVLSYTIEKIGIEQGLSNNNVLSIAQDRDGFIWICTRDGLNRFDSHAFKTFKKSPADANSISSNVLNYVYADKFDDILWIATEKNGIDAYNYKTHVFTHYEHDNTHQDPNSLGANGITHITADEKGNLWLATYQAGIDYFDKETGNFIHYNQSNVTDLVSNYNWCVMYDTGESIYAGHVLDGFSIINIRERNAVNFRHDPSDPSSLADNTVTCIFKDSKNNIWIGTRNGLTLFDPVNSRMTNFYNDPADPFTISNNFIKCFIETDDHELWIGTEGGGVNILDLSSVSGISDLSEIRFQRINESPAPDGLTSASAQSILQDSYGNIWIGGFVGGLNVINHRERYFNRISYLPFIGNYNSLDYMIVPDICVDKDNRIWVANGSGGISIFDKGEKIRNVKVNNTPEPQNITCILTDSENTIWAGTDDGKIYKFNENTDRFIQQTCFEDLDNIPLYNFFEDSKRNLWISTDIGLHVYNILTGECKVYNTSNSGLSDNVIRTVAEDIDGNMWVGTLIGGLCVFDEEFNLIVNHGRTYDFYSVNHIYKDNMDRIWVASQNDLFLFSKNSADSAVRIGQKEGLAETDIRAIAEGRSPDEIWLSTINGISFIDLKTMHISNFDVNDGIEMGDYMSGSMSKTHDGTIYFGSQHGITWFNQVLEESDYLLPETVFTSFLVSDTKIKNLNEFTDIPFSDSIELEHFQNSFQLYFNVLDFSLSGRVEFIFQMKGLDDGWYLIDGDNYVTFRNLKPGNYTFNLKTRLHNAEWPDEARSMFIAIDPPLWMSGWAKLFYILLITLILYFTIRFYSSKLRIENSLMLERMSREQEKELNEEKIKFFTNITHELRTPMTLILGPLEDLMADRSLQPEQEKKISSIHRVASRLLYLINQILEFRKSSNKNRKLRVIKDDFVKFVYETGLKYSDLNTNKSVEFRITVPDIKIEMFYDPEVVTIILDNLLSNAFKYTREGTIQLELENYEDTDIGYTELIVSDTGFGISETDLPHIYERYYQAKNTSYPVSGTGIGLALVKNMVELHEAEISVTSQVNKGSTFKVRFLNKNSYPEAIHTDPEEAHPEVMESAEDMKNVILVVDDNQEILDYIHDNLTDNYLVLVAENGKAGYELACEKVPDIVISDIMMPVLDGIEMCKVMKRDVRTSHIPVILLTAKNSTQDKSEGYDAGADSYLTKPFSINLLKSRLRNILEARKKLSEEYSSKFKHKQLLFNDSISQLDKEFLNRLKMVIEENLEDEEMNISQVAARLNMSHSTLYRKIKALTNLTANEYIRKVRISVAEQLLLTNQYTISEIMYRIGMNSSSYFRQCFKDEFGMNPSEYLQKLKKEQT